MRSGHAGRRVRRQFSEEFKEGAVRLVLNEGKTIGAVARELDLTASALSLWVHHARAERTKGKSGLLKEEREELTRLRKENRELRIERDLLKKWSCAAAHPRRHESGSVGVAGEPGQGRRLLVLRARKKMDPSAAPQAPRTVALVPARGEEHAR
ncbi:MAG: transposase [Vicinamibacterales bacterium]